MKWIIAKSYNMSNFGDTIFQMALDEYIKIGLRLWRDFNNMASYHQCSVVLLIKSDSKSIHKSMIGVILFRKVKYGNKIGLVISKDNRINKNSRILY